MVRDLLRNRVWPRAAKGGVVLLALGGCLLTEPPYPESRENSPPVIVGWSVDPSSDPKASIQYLQMVEGEGQLNFEVEVYDQNNPEALEVTWIRDHLQLPVPDGRNQREQLAGQTDSHRVFKYPFSPLGESYNDCWKITASVCDGAHYAFEPGCIGEAFEVTTFWYVCAFNEDPAAECHLENCP